MTARVCASVLRRRWKASPSSTSHTKQNISDAMEFHDQNSFAILVVEDEPLLLMDAVDMIEDAGFRTYQARSAGTALALMERHDDIRVLFTDIDMPGSMNGIDLAARVRDQWPPTVILVTSGIVGLTKDTLPDGARFFPKPYSANHIIGTLARIAADLGRG